MRTIALMAVLAFLPACGLYDTYTKLRAGGEQLEVMAEKVETMARKIPQFEAVLDQADLDGDGKVSGWGEYKELVMGAGGILALLGVNKARKTRTDELYDKTTSSEQRLAALEGARKGS